MDEKLVSRKHLKEVQTEKVVIKPARSEGRCIERYDQFH